MSPTFDRNAKSTPTPGPWVPTRDSGLRWRIQTAGDKGTLAYMTARPSAWAGNFSHAQIEANARLIAAAPDLLAALENCVAANVWSDPAAKEEARAVIAKLRGAV